jgi:hypothetical protein
MKLFINNLGCVLRDNSLKLFQEITNVEQEARRLGINENEIESSLRKRYSSLSQKALLDIRERTLIKYHKENDYADISYEDWSERVAKSEIGSIPSLDLYLSLMKQFVLERVRNKQLKIALSDGPDLWHASYAPYCDIIRVDKRTYDLIN